MESRMYHVYQNSNCLYYMVQKLDGWFEILLSLNDGWIYQNNAHLPPHLSRMWLTMGTTLMQLLLMMNEYSSSSPDYRDSDDEVRWSSAVKPPSSQGCGGTTMLCGGALLAFQSHHPRQKEVWKKGRRYYEGEGRGQSHPDGRTLRHLLSTTFDRWAVRWALKSASTPPTSLYLSGRWSLPTHDSRRVLPTHATATTTKQLYYQYT